MPRKTNTGAYSFAYVFLPYCLKRHDDGTWSILNRRYQNLGDIDRTTHRRYTIRPGDERRIKRLAYNQNGDEFWLYADGCVPWRSAKHFAEYTNRLNTLMALMVSE